MTAKPVSSVRRVRSARVLDVFAAACTIVAVLLFVWPTPSGDVPSAAAREPTKSPASATVPPIAAESPALNADASSESDSLIAVIVNGNVFSSTRRAPRTRFLPPTERALVAESPPAYGASRIADPSSDSLPALSGIVAVNGERRALLQMVAADEAPRLYRVNETHAGYRVMQIGPDMVVLASRAGTRTLRLSRSAPPDSLEKQP